MSIKVPITDQLSAAWLQHQQQERTPPNTIDRRQATLRSVGNAGTATREEIETWWQTRAHLAPATRANDLANLRAFYKWAARWEHRLDDPTARLDAPKVANGIPRPISRTDLHTVLEHATPEIRRAVALGAYAGMRVSEAATLNWSDIDLEQRRAHVTGKGNKRRVIALSHVLLDELLPPVQGANVVTGTANGHTPARLERKANRAIKAAGVSATFHQLRHRYGTLGYQATGDLVAVANQMGHASVVTTAIYAQASAEAADRIAEAASR